MLIHPQILTVYTKKDVEAGLKLVIEITGAISLGSSAFTVLTGWLPAIGITLAPAIISKILIQLAKGYTQLSAEQRKEVRAAVKWIKRAVNLTELFNNFENKDL